jgi:hypothetical protein
MEKSHAYFCKWMLEVQDGDIVNSMIVVASLGSASMTEELAVFVEAVSVMKARHKAGESNEEEVSKKKSSGWRDAKEYEGRKQAPSPSGSKDYEYLHGPLCNALTKELKSQITKVRNVTVRSNQNIDVALVDQKSKKALAIFEVKTSASLSAQLYAAIGQLAYYKHEYGTQNTKIYLVLPHELQNELHCGEFLSSIGIGLIFRKNKSFEPESERSLNELVRRVCAKKLGHRRVS